MSIEEMLVEAELRGYNRGLREYEERKVEQSEIAATRNEKMIIATVSRHYSLDIEVMRFRSRKRSVVFPRQIAMYLLCKYTKLSLKRIGNMLGGKDHTTVVHSRDTILDLLDVSDGLAGQIRAVEEEVIKNLVDEPKLFYPTRFKSKKKRKAIL